MEECSTSLLLFFESKAESCRDDLEFPLEGLTLDENSITPMLTLSMLNNRSFVTFDGVELLKRYPRVQRQLLCSLLRAWVSGVA